MAAPHPPASDAPAAPLAWALAIHGGAGVVDAADGDPACSVVALRRGLRGMRRALRAGALVLAAGGSSLDATCAAVARLEDDPRFNAGRGSVLTRSGRYELEASVMVCEQPPPRGGEPVPLAHADGGDGSGALRCGAAALLTRAKNPVRVARLVMERAPHTFLAGAEAEAFCERELGAGALLPTEAEAGAYFGTEARHAQWRRWRAASEAEAGAGAGPACAARPDDIAQQRGDAAGGSGGGGLGTVGAVAVDDRGALASATSTGGRVGKWDGRVGDTPVIGAGGWADRRVAVSGTGVGEAFARRCAAKEVAARVEHAGATLSEAAEAVVFRSLAPGDGGVVCVGRAGEVAMPFNTPGMWRGAADALGRFEVGVFGPMEAAAAAAAADGEGGGWRWEREVSDDTDASEEEGDGK